MSFIMVLEYIVVMIYVAVGVFALLGGVLYWYAYKEMKHTLIIRAVSFVLFAICIDGFWWGFTEFVRLQSSTNSYSPWMVSPVTLLIEKSIVAVAVICFVRRSVKDEGGFVECAKKSYRSRQKGKP